METKILEELSNLIHTFINGYSSYAGYLWHEITHPNWHNYFYWLILVSIFFFSLEVIKPWRQNQPIIRRDFWIDLFYVFFNFFLFSLIIYNAASDVVVGFVNSLVYKMTSIDLKQVNPMYNWPAWSVLLIGFLVRDFVQWWTHRLLHRVPKLWEFHKVHHSVEEMGFAAHLRYHWMENVVYRSIEYFPLALLGIGLHDFFIIHIFTLAIGHYNHSNFVVSGKISGGVIGALVGIVIRQSLLDIHLLNDSTFLIKMSVFLLSIMAGAFLLGPFMKKIFNSPDMHIWHHAYDIPEDKKYGINFGISLAIWDYIFGTAHIPSSGRDIRLGFPGIESFPTHFKDQAKIGF